MKWLYGVSKKDFYTNVVSIVAVVLTAVQTYLDRYEQIDWFRIGIGVSVAIIGWYTGKYVQNSK